MNVRLWMLCLGCWLCLIGCGDNATPQTAPEPPAVTPFVFTHQGMSGRVVERLYQQQDKLLALTDDGL